MDEDNANQNMDDEGANKQMARQIEQRREARPERRGSSSGPSNIERRSICMYCYQPGDHPTLADCLRALERH